MSSPNYQQIILIGNVGGDAELRYLPSGVPVASFNMAVNEEWTKDGEKQSKTVWFRVTTWNKLAEIVAQYVKKGNSVMAIGKVEEARPYTDKQGNGRASLEVTANTVKFLGSSNNNAPAEYAADPHANNAKGEDIPF